MSKIVLKIGGMSCSACSNGLEKYLNKQDGINQATVNLVMANAMIDYDEAKVTRKMLDKFVKDAGFESLGIYNENEEEKTGSSKKILFIVFAALSVILMYVSMGHMIGLPEIPLIGAMSNPLGYALALAVLTVPFLVYGFDILKSGIKNALHKMPNMDTLVALGVTSSFLYSVYGLIMTALGSTEHVHSLYFESSAIVIFFIKLGRYIDSVSKDRTKDAIKSLVQITPRDATIKLNGVEKSVTIDEIKKGDTVISRPGERIAVDGTVTAGRAHIDESFITGESKPALRKPGDRVIAGSTDYDGYIEYRAEKIGRESKISEIVRIVVEATSTKAPLARIADTISGFFVPAIILIALLSFIGYLLAGQSFAAALNTFVTVLVVACPCSLGLATPLAIVVSEGKCAGKGILIKRSEVLENASKTDTVVFDKTGTLTYGKLKIAAINNYSGLDDNELISLAAALEAGSSHPIAKAFTGFASAEKLSVPQADDFESIDGKGITAAVNGKRYFAGNAGLMAENGIDGVREDDGRRLSEDGNSLVYIADENSVLGLIGVNDVLRENAARVVTELREMGIETVMLTGDNETTAEKAAARAGIDRVIAGVLPADKGAAIKTLQAAGKRIMMVGDGINDSPALTISDIGVGMNSGSDIAMDSSDVILMNGDLSRIPELIKTSGATVKNIKQNLFWAFFYNCLMVPIAIGALKPLGIVINPMLGSIAMTVSSLTVILNALRLKK